MAKSAQRANQGNATRRSIRHMPPALEKTVKEVVSVEHSAKNELTNLRKHLRLSLDESGQKDLARRRTRLKRHIKSLSRENPRNELLWERRHQELGMVCCALGLLDGPKLFEEALRCFDETLACVPSDEHYWGLVQNNRSATCAWYGAWLYHRGDGDLGVTHSEKAIAGYEQALRVLDKGTIHQTQALHNRARAMLRLAERGRKFGFTESRRLCLAKEALDCFHQVKAQIEAHNRRGGEERLAEHFRMVEENVEELERLMGYLTRTVEAYDDKSGEERRMPEGNDAPIASTTLREPFAGTAKSAPERLEALEAARRRLESRRATKRELQIEDAADVQTLIDQQKLNMPVGQEAREAFCDEITRELKEAKLVLNVDGEIVTALAMSKGSVAGVKRGGGYSGFLRATVVVVPDNGQDKAGVPEARYVNP